MIGAIVTFFVSILLSSLLVRALWKKEVVFGGPPGLVFGKKEKPIKYWGGVVMLFLATGVSLLMLITQLRSLFSR